MGSNNPYWHGPANRKTYFESKVFGCKSDVQMDSDGWMMDLGKWLRGLYCCTPQLTAQSIVPLCHSNVGEFWHQLPEGHALVSGCGR